MEEKKKKKETCLPMILFSQDNAQLKLILEKEIKHNKKRNANISMLTPHKEAAQKKKKTEYDDDATKTSIWARSTSRFRKTSIWAEVALEEISASCQVTEITGMGLNRPFLGLLCLG